MLEVDGLRVAYGPVEAVHGISFTVERGEVVTLIGANGAGKTSTLAAISGLVRPTGGRVVFNGRDLVARPTHAIVASGLVQVPEGREILARMTVEENLLMGSRGRGGAAALGAVWDRFPLLADRRAMPAGNLSGGEQQMLAIARALLASPLMLLLDEPSLGLAPLLVATIFEILADLKRQGTTMLLVEQNALRALRLADRAFVMDLGRITVAGTGAELLKDEAVARAYLGG